MGKSVMDIVDTVQVNDGERIDEEKRYLNRYSGSFLLAVTGSELNIDQSYWFLRFTVLEGNADLPTGTTAHHCFDLNPDTRKFPWKLEATARDLKYFTAAALNLAPSQIKADTIRGAQGADGVSSIISTQVRATATPSDTGYVNVRFAPH